MLCSGIGGDLVLRPQQSMSASAPAVAPAILGGVDRSHA
jgi:hypothetical protein